MSNTLSNQNYSDLPEGKLHSQHSFKRYRFNPTTLRELRPFFKLDNFHGLYQVLEDWFLIGLAIALSMGAWENVPIILAFPIYLIAVIIIGARQRGLANLLHQATHLTLAKNKLFNFLLGTLASGYLVLQSFTGYTFSHVLNHHPLLGDPELDGNYVRLQQNGMYGEGRCAENTRSYLKNIFHLATTLNYARYLVKNKIFNSHEALWERWMRLTYITVMIAGVWFLGWGNLLLLYWIIPFLTTANWVGNFVEVAEHYPLMETAPKVDIYMSRNRLFNPAWCLLLGVHNEHFHLIHHLFERIPFWHLKTAHKVLMQDEVYASLNQSQGFYALLTQIVVPTNHN